MSILHRRIKGNIATNYDGILNMEQRMLNVEWPEPLHFNIQYSPFNIECLGPSDVEPRPTSVTLTHFAKYHRRDVPAGTCRDIGCPSATATATENNDLRRREAPAPSADPRKIRSYVNENVRRGQMSLKMSLRRPCPSLGRHASDGLGRPCRAEYPPLDW